ncbi:MAG: hypothetical protein DMF74_03660 [Acidobacteria bacterium]|nr:MAG: hypothetical protein DMF74_03660 [Acidobacteriota bacterium]
MKGVQEMGGGRYAFGCSHFHTQAPLSSMNKTRCSSKVLDMHKLAEYKPPIPRVFDSAPRGTFSN